MINDFERRLIGHLPVWTADEDALVAAEGGPGVAVRSYTLAQFTERMNEDPKTPMLEEEAMGVLLGELVKLGFAWRDGSGVKPVFGMTEAGFNALHEPVESNTVGSVEIEVHPARSGAKAEAA